jgi:hypothetical protein
MESLVRHCWKCRILPTKPVQDTLKGSYYANPVVDSPSVSSALKKSYPEYYSNNICNAIFSHLYRYHIDILSTGPKGEPTIEEFEDAFKSLGRYIL